VQPDLTAIFALRLSSQRKLMLIAMIHRAKQGWYWGTAAMIARDASCNINTMSEAIRKLEAANLIHPHPDNKPTAPFRRWHLDPKFIVETQNGKSGMDGSRGRDAASVVDGGTVSGGNRAADFPAEKQRHQQKPSPAP
jgi:hypothetical protein